MKVAKGESTVNRRKQGISWSLILVALLLTTTAALAGDLDTPAPPSDPGSAMFTLEDLYNRLSYGTAGAKRSGAFTGPVATPGSTMRTLDQIMAKAPALNGSAATAAEVVTGKTYWGLSSGSNWGALTGAMANVGAQNITPGTTPQTISQGYHDGTGTVAGDANLVTANIKSGATIFGVAGNANVVNTSSGTATAGSLLTGATAWVAGAEVTGTMANVGAQNITPSTTPRTITQGYHDGTGTVAGDANLVTANIKSGATIFGVGGNANVLDTSSGTATAGSLLSGATAWVAGAEVTGTMANVGAQNITPGTTPRTISQGYHSGTGTVAGDANLVTANIKSGVSIFGVSGDANVVNTSSGTATAGSLLSGTTAWVDGAEITGAMPNVGAQNITPSTTSQTISPGYHSGAGAVAGDANLTAGNIKAGATVFGVTGTFTTAIAKRVNKTGQTTCWNALGNSIGCSGTGQDGDYQYGIDPVVAPTGGITGAYNSPVSTGTRFIDNNDGTVIDTLTALIWQKDSSCHGAKTWQGALDACNDLSATSGCGLSDGSTAGQWRLPNVNELHSLGPVWPLAAPFVGNLASHYWSSTTYAFDVNSAWVVYFYVGFVYYYVKSYGYYVRCVRGGQ